jgi:hypothetical protein
MKCVKRTVNPLEFRRNNFDALGYCVCGMNLPEKKEKYIYNNVTVTTKDKLSITSVHKIKQNTHLRLAICYTECSYKYGVPKLEQFIYRTLIWLS